jgi:lysyl-tRNA synthetase class II
MSEQMEAMQLLFSKSENSRTLVDEKLSILAENLNGLTGQIGQSTPSNAALERVAIGQEKLFEVLSNIEKNDAADAESRMRLRSIDVQMLHLMEDLASGRQEITSAIRSELSSLSAIISEANSKVKGKN